MKKLIYILITLIALTLILTTPQNLKAETKSPEVTSATDRIATEEAKAIEKGESSINREEYREKIKQHLPQFQSCYSEARKTDKALKGKIIITFTVDEEGTVTTAEVDKKSSLNNEVLNQCMISEINKIDFPSPPKGALAEISYPFEFKPNRKGSVRILR